MAPTKMTLQTSQLVAVKEDTADWKATIKSFAGSATARNMVDLLLVITILVLLGIAAPIIRGDHCGEFFSYRHGRVRILEHLSMTPDITISFSAHSTLGPRIRTSKLSFSCVDI